MARAPKKTAPAGGGGGAAEELRGSAAGAFVTIVAHRNLEVDGVAIAEGETAEIRAELLDGLVAIEAASLVEDMG